MDQEVGNFSTSDSESCLVRSLEFQDELLDLRRTPNRIKSEYWGGLPPLAR